MLLSYRIPETELIYKHQKFLFTVLEAGQFRVKSKADLVCGKGPFPIDDTI